MGIATGRFLLDTHVHAQRHAFKFKERGIKPSYSTLAEGMADVDVYDNSPRLLYDMERYGVDMCVLIPAFGMTDELNAEIVKIQNRPDVRQEWAGQGALPMVMTPDEFGRYLNDDVAKWERIVKISGAKADQ